MYNNNYNNDDDDHRGRKCAFVKTSSQYPNIPIPQYNFISGYNFPNIPISQYPNLYWDIGISGCPREPGTTVQGGPHQHTCQAGLLLLGPRPILPTAQRILLGMCFRAPGHQNTCQAERAVRWTVWAEGTITRGLLGMCFGGCYLGFWGCCLGWGVAA